MSHRSKVRLRAAAVLGVLATFVVALLLPSAGGAAPPGCKNRTNTTYQTLLECVTLEGVRAHQAAFQEIADDNDNEFYPGTRAAGTEGYAGSVEYVAGLLEDAGYKVTLEPFQFPFDFPVVIEQLTPTPGEYPSGAFTNSGFGEVTAAVVPIDINLTPPRANDSGCTNDATSGLPENDFVGFPAGAIALIQRGTCTFAEKAQNAQTAGAAAVIIFNQGNDPTREGLIIGTLVPFQATIPVVGASFADGVALSQVGSTAHIEVVEPETRTDMNVIAELPGRNTNNVVMAGAHLDSVTEGPGINDNGSGSAALLETALMMAKVKPENTLRFAWWGAEELGLIGSEAYVAGLSEAERDRIAMYMNYDMVGSPNYVFFVYDGDNSDGVGAPAGPPGSAAIEDVYEAFYTARNLPYKGTDFDGRSDYGPFIATGVEIPAGGLFTGAEGIKTAADVALWGGIAGAQYDPCYHLACDTFTGTGSGAGSTAPGRGPIALEVNSDLIAYAQLTFAFSTESVNGEPGRPVPGSGGFTP
jgi:Zn-dependent M28 family amino/carboxypeptidase